MKDSKLVFLIIVAAVSFVLPQTASGTQILLDRSPGAFPSIGLQGLANQEGSQFSADTFSFTVPVSVTGMDIYGAKGTTQVGQSTTVRLWDGGNIFTDFFTIFTEAVSDVEDLDVVNPKLGFENGLEKIHVAFTTPLNLLPGRTYMISLSGTDQQLGLASFFHSTVDDGQFTVWNVSTGPTRVENEEPAFRLHGNTLSQIPDLNTLPLFDQSPDAFPKVPESVNTAATLGVLLAAYVLASAHRRGA